MNLNKAYIDILGNVVIVGDIVVAPVKDYRMLGKAKVISIAPKTCLLKFDE